MTTLLTTSHCSYEQTHEGIHIFRFESPSRRAFDEFLLHMEGVANSQIAEGALREGALRIVIEYSLRGLPHLSYAAQRARMWMACKQQRQPLFIAFVYQNQEFPMLVDNLVRLLRIPAEQVRYFTRQQSDLAFEWLRWC